MVRAKSSEYWLNITTTKELNMMDRTAFQQFESIKTDLFNLVPNMQGGVFCFEGIVFNQFGWCIFAMNETFGTEPFYAVGHHEDGKVISAFRKMSGNHLYDWIEEKVVLEKTWFDSTIDPVWRGDEENDRCLSVLRVKSLDGPHQPFWTPDKAIVKKQPFHVTIIKHKTFAGGSEQDKINEYSCSRFKSWYEGLFDEGLQISPLIVDWDDSVEYGCHGFNLYGRIKNKLKILEWPTTDFEYIKSRIDFWLGQKEVKDLHFSKSSLSISLDQNYALSKSFIKISETVRRHGSDFYLHEIISVDYRISCDILQIDATQSIWSC